MTASHRPLLLSAVLALAACGAPEDVDDPYAEIEQGLTYRVPDGDLRREPLQEGSGPSVVFRYRSYSGARPSWVSPGSTTITHALGAGIVAVERGPGFERLFSTRFDGSTGGYLGDRAIAAQSVGFTIDALFKAKATTGYRTLFSNTESDRGFNLKIVDGHLRGLVRTVSGSGTVSHEVRDPAELQVDRWTSAAFRVSMSGTQLVLRLYRDGRLVAESKVAKGGGIANSSARPAVGAEPTGGRLDKDWFSGEIHSVQVHDFPVDHDLLATPWLRDGSRGLGFPSFHDTLSDTPGAARRITATDRDYTDLARARVRLGTPLLNDGYTPQGLAVSADGRTMYLSAYHHDEGKAAATASVVAEIDLTQLTVRRIFRLVEPSGRPWTGHAGGIAVAHGNLYVPASRKILRFALPTTKPKSATAPAVPVETLVLAQTFATRSQGSYLDYDAARDALWVGEFATSGKAKGALDRYDLDATGRVLRPSTSKSDQRFVLPLDEVQGAAAYTWTDGRSVCFVLSQSYGDRPSRLSRWCPTGLPVRLAELPAGIEDLDLGPDGTLWTWSESGARAYQKREVSPWTDFSPFVVGFDRAKLGF